MLRLTKLINALPAELRRRIQVLGDPDIDILGLAEDSRKVKPGFVFVAISGGKIDGKKFVPHAIDEGAAAIISTEKSPVDSLFPQIITTQPRLVLGHLAKNFVGNQPEFIAAITGTNGKSSTVHFCRQIWHLLGKKSASIGTLGVFTSMNDAENFAWNPVGGAMTTPDVVDMHSKLHGLYSKGISHVALEASSHGMHQYRIAGVDIKAGGFTNLTQDHLDYHGTMEYYKAAKMLLFSEYLAGDGVAAVNRDMAEFFEIENICKGRGIKLLSYGKDSAADLVLEDVKLLPSGQEVSISYQGKSYNFRTNLMGLFQVYNLLNAILIVAESGFELGKIINVLHEVTNVPGRMEKVFDDGKKSILIDYAHTPDGLKNALLAARPHVSNRLIVVFGCGGERDKTKRPKMGRTAGDLADIVIVTDDNPRSENPQEIRTQIIAAVQNAKDRLIEIGDREQAIKRGIAMMQDGDILLIAGKGHETEQILATGPVKFSDKDVVLSSV